MATSALQDEATAALAVNAARREIYFLSPHDGDPRSRHLFALPLDSMRNASAARCLSCDLFALNISSGEREQCLHVEVVVSPTADYVAIACHSLAVPVFFLRSTAPDSNGTCALLTARLVYSERCCVMTIKLLRNFDAQPECSRATHQCSTCSGAKLSRSASSTTSTSRCRTTRAPASVRSPRNALSLSLLNSNIALPMLFSLFSTQYSCVDHCAEVWAEVWMPPAAAENPLQQFPILWNVCVRIEQLALSPLSIKTLQILEMR